MAKNKARIFLLRHGEVATKGLLCGHTDIALSENGLKQLHQRGASLPPIDLCFSSPLSRCASFARQFRNKQQQRMQLAPKLTMEDALQEMNFGDWDGKAYKALWQETSQPNIGDFWQDPWQHTPPNGESMADFSARINAIWQQILIKSQGKNTLVVTHAGVIKQIIADVIGLTMPASSHLCSINVPYSGIVKIDVHYDDLNHDESPSDESTSNKGISDKVISKTKNNLTQHIWPSINF